MSEGARHGDSFAALKLRLSDQRRPTLSSAAGPEPADEGGGSDVGAAYCAAGFEASAFKSRRPSRNRKGYRRAKSTRLLLGLPAGSGGFAPGSRTKILPASIFPDVVR